MTPTRDPATAPIHAYHHGDLARGLVKAGRRILESEGPAALSLRAVAREAGVSPAAPYHHFKDKCALLDAVAGEGWAMGEHPKGANHAVVEAIVDAGADPNNARELELASIAAWCAPLGLAELAGFREFEPLKAALGGEDAWVRAVLGHVGISARGAGQE